jgi:hypothetical protein
VADLPGEVVASFLQVADALDVAPVGFAGVDVAENVQGREDPPVHRDGVPVALPGGDHASGNNAAGPGMSAAAGMAADRVAGGRPGVAEGQAPG